MTNFFTRKLVRMFFNTYYRVKRPSMVKFWEWGKGKRAKKIVADDGSYQMLVEGEAYPHPGFPRGHVLMGPLAQIKNRVKNLVFNTAFAEISKLVDEAKYDMVPPEHMMPAVRELHDKLVLLENIEVNDTDMKPRIAMLRKVITFFLQEDDAYRFRFQWVMERLNMDKMKLSDADLYYMRGKYIKPDQYDKKGNPKYDY